MAAVLTTNCRVVLSVFLLAEWINSVIFLKSGTAKNLQAAIINYLCLVYKQIIYTRKKINYMLVTKCYGSYFASSTEHYLGLAVKATHYAD